HNQRVLLLAHQHERPMDLVEAVAQDLLVHGRVATPDERIAAARAIDGDALAAAARSLVAAAPTLALVGRAGRGDHLAGLRRRLG
ncbi:MAG: hypothetical protein AB7O55_23560, partial [Lautropia sp.]